MKRILIISLIIISCLFLSGCEDKEEKVYKENIFSEIKCLIPDTFEKDDDYIYILDIRIIKMMIFTVMLVFIHMKRNIMMRIEKYGLKIKSELI